ncbi:MAG: aminoglycoside phosphotransferase family protein [Acidimicrobiales bacterium]
MISPAAEIEVGEGLIRSLLVEQHPDLADLPVTEVDSGWDNALWRIGDDLLARLPRRQIAVPLTINEQRWLPELAQTLPLPVPVPVRIGRPSDAFPWPWSVVQWIEGHPGDRAEIIQPEETACRLGRFLRALHQEAPSNAPTNPYRGVPLAERAPDFERWLSQIGSRVDHRALRRVWDRALGAGQWSRPPAWIHGDLHPANTIVEHGALTAVIDFGDICAGDPATDLAGAWMLLPYNQLATFAAVYGGVDLELEQRTLGWVVLFALMQIAIGIDDRPTYGVVGHSALVKAIERSEGVS